MLRSGYLSPSIDQTLECMFLLAFFGFLRCSEFAPMTSAFNPVIHPSLSDISAHTPDSLIYRYTLKKSKTNQFGESFPIYIFRLNSFLSPYEPDVPIILLLKNLSFLQKMEKLPQDSGLTSTFKRFSVPQAYLPNTTPYIPSGLEQPQRPPAQVSQTKP